MQEKKFKALVTGSTRGIGLSIVKNLLENNIEVIATGTGDNFDYPAVEYYPINFNNSGSFEKFLKFAESAKIDILVNNAGINKIDKFENIKVEDFKRIINVNLTAPFRICQAVIPHMKKQNWGRIVNIASIWSQKSREYRASYSASKFGLDGMSLALAAEQADSGILVNCVSPGFTRTDLTENILGSKEILEIEKTIPIGRLAKTEEIANIVNWLVSESNSYLTGQNIMIDGGFSRV